MSVSGVIVLTLCVCVSVCPLPPSQTNVPMYGLEFWHGGQLDGYLGQVYRSRPTVKATRSQNVHWDFSLTSESLVYGPAREETQDFDRGDYDVGCFQSVCGFIQYVIIALLSFSELL